MTPALKALAERAIAAGAPEADDNTVIVIPGVSFRSIATGLVYDRATRLPLLSHSIWLGWVLDEVERRGYRYCLEVWRQPGTYRAAVQHAKTPGQWTRQIHSSRPEALVAMLEATR